MTPFSTLQKKCVTLKGRIEKYKVPPTPRFETSTHVTRVLLHQFVEAEFVKDIRQRTYQLWPHTSPSAKAMINAGWFYCKIHDRVLCLYCDTICHRWKSSDDPAEVHRRFAPHCPFLPLMVVEQPSFPLQITTVENTCQPRHSSMRSVSCRHATFEKYPWKQESPTIDAFVRAGFFHSGVENTVTCFYCSGSLQKWSPNDDPMIEHARWFPTCEYARHLCGDHLHARIQLKHHEHIKKKNPDSDHLRRSVNARLDLPAVQKLREKYSIGIIRRCIEDQLTLGKDDFANTSDLYMACQLIQKQLDVIQGKFEKILIPSLNESVTVRYESSTATRKFDDCVICFTEERQLACLPCGHLSACTPCAYSLDSCPICRQKIQSFVRIYSS